MKKFVYIISLVTLVLCLSVCSGVLAETPTTETMDSNLDAIIQQAEKVLLLEFKNSLQVDKDNPLPDDIKITGPFLYVGLEDNETKVYLPNESSYKYVPAGLPDGAKIYVFDNTMIEYIYSGIINQDSNSSTIYTILIGTGYYNGAKYDGDLTVCDRDYAVLFVDYASGEIVAWTDGNVHYGAPYTLYSDQYFKDMNERYVFYRDVKSLNDIWSDTLLYASANDAGAVIQNGVLVTMQNKDIESFVVPEGVTAIGDQAFSYCTSLKSVKFPEGLASIGWLAFEGCEQLEHIEFPEGLEIIDINAFNGCKQLESIKLPEGLLSLGAEAFVNCTALKDITFPTTLIEIGMTAFEGTAWLEERKNDPFIIVGDGVLLKANPLVNEEAKEASEELIAAFGDDLSSVDEEILREYEEKYGLSLTVNELIIPEGIKYLAEGSLCDIAVNRIVLPSTLTDFWGSMYAFVNVRVEEIYISDGVLNIPGGIFMDCKGLKRVRIPESIVWFQEFLFEGKEDVVVVCPSENDAYRQAKECGYKVEIEK
ncbi:MAG: leucine-rich repeat domain-containing protein [Christensenellaceae bacterium]|nr:leucine-rich repeat domain-containing protein [Christensenellaceae bacterium]